MQPALLNGGKYVRYIKGLDYQQWTYAEQTMINKQGEKCKRYLSFGLRGALSPGASSVRRGLVMLIWCHKLKDLESNFPLWWQLGLLRSPGSKPEAAGTLVGLSESIWQDDVRVEWWHSCINDFKCLWVDAVKAVRSPKKRRTDISYVAKMWMQMCVVDLDLSLAYPQPKHLENHWFIPYYWTLKYIGCTLTMTVSSGLLFFTSSYLHRHITAS